MPEDSKEFSLEDKLTLQQLVVEVNVKLSASPEDGRLPGADKVQTLRKEYPELISRFREIGHEISDMRISDEAGSTLAQVEEELAKLREERVALLEGLIKDKFKGSLPEFKKWWHELPTIENRGRVHTAAHRDQLI